MRRVLGTLVVVAAAAIASPLCAQGDPGRLAVAAEEFDEGTKAFKRKEYEEAAAHFEAADRYAPSASALGNAIRARKSAKQLARAATLSTQAIARFPDDKALADVAKDFLKQNEKSLQKLDVSCSPGCTLALDGKIASAEPVATYVMYLDPGSHTLIAGWSGDRSRPASVEAKKGGSDALKLEAPPEKKAPPPPPVASATPSAITDTPPPPPPKKEGLPPVFVYGGAAVTAVLLGVSIWSGLDTKSNPGVDRVRAECAGLPSDCPAFAQGKRKELRTDVLFGATAAVGLATGVVAAFFTDWSPSAKNEAPATGRVRVVPVLSPDKSVGIFAGALF